MRSRHRPALRLALGLATAALLTASCTGSSDAEAADELPFGDESSEEANVEESTATGSTAEVQEVGLDGVEGLWLDAGASPELAACYRSVLEEAGVDTEVDIRTLEDVVVVQEALTERQQAKFNNCLNQGSGAD